MGFNKIHRLVKKSKFTFFSNVRKMAFCLLMVRPLGESLYSALASG